MKRTPAKRQAGVTLIEVLVTILVLAIGLLGIAAVQTTAMTGNFASYQATQASFLATGMMERIRANRAAYANGNSYYQLTAGSTPSVTTTCYSSACTPQQQAQWDMAVWYSQVTGVSAGSGVTTLGVKDSAGNPIGALPGGQASITCDSPFPITGPGKCIVSVYWDPGRISPSGSNKYNCDNSSGSYTCFRLAAVLP
jgi:type IV pilus assembly protein PilV